MMGGGTGERARFRHALAGEWTKFWTSGSSSPALAGAAALGVGVAALLTWAGSAAPRAEADGGCGDFGPLLAGMTGGAAVGQIVICSLGALMAAAEYSSGTLHSSFVAVPRRSRVLFAKALVMVPASLAVGLVVAAGSLAGGQAVLAATDAGSVTLTGPSVAYAVGCVSLCHALAGVLGVSLGFLLRSALGAAAMLTAPATGVPLLLGLAGAPLGRCPESSASVAILLTVVLAGRVAASAACLTCGLQRVLEALKCQRGQ